MGKTDNEVTSDKKLINGYHERDDIALETERPNIFKEELAPTIHHGLIKQVICTKYPIYMNSDKPNAVLGIIVPENKLVNLDPVSLLTFSLLDFKQFLPRTRYTVNHNNISYSIARSEMLCLIGLIKGKSAKEMAISLKISSRTAECYIQSLKDKCHFSKKGQLIDFFIDNKLLQQIVV